MSSRERTRVKVQLTVGKKVTVTHRKPRLARKRTVKLKHFAVREKKTMTFQNAHDIKLGSRIAPPKNRDGITINAPPEFTHQNTMDVLDHMSNLLTHFETQHNDIFQEALMIAYDKASPMPSQSPGAAFDQYFGDKEEDDGDGDGAGDVKTQSVRFKEDLGGTGGSRSRSGSADLSGDDDEIIRINSPLLRVKTKYNVLGGRETMRLIDKFQGSEEQFDDLTKQELDEDPNMWLLSMDAMDSMQSPADVAAMLIHLGRSINLIEKYIPNINDFLKTKDDTKVYFTSVIQELLKQANNMGKLRGVQQNWSRWKGADLHGMVQSDVSKLVDYMAWVRNNIRASNVTDYNDAKQANAGAHEIKESLKTILKHHEERND